MSFARLWLKHIRKGAVMNRVVNLLRYDWPLHVVLLLTFWLPDNVQALRLRGYLAHFFLRKCGRNFRLGRNVTLYNPAKIEIGNDVYIAYGNWFSAAEMIIIEDEVIIGPYCIFASSNHTKMNGSFRYGPPVEAPVRIGRGSWIAGQCSVLAGSEIGSGVLVAANSVVTGELRDDFMYAGSPVKPVKAV